MYQNKICIKEGEKKYGKKKFECGYCGEKYDSVYDRSICEANCYKKEKDK